MLLFWTLWWDPRYAESVKTVSRKGTKKEYELIQVICSLHEGFDLSAQRPDTYIEATNQK